MKHLQQHRPAFLPTCALSTIARLHTKTISSLGTVRFPCFLAALCAGAMLATAGAQQPTALQRSIPAPIGPPQTGATLGYSVATDGGFAVVGAPYDDVGAISSGVVKVFDAATGALLHVLKNPSPGRDDRFGWAVAISGTRVVVGAVLDDTAATDAGAAYVYDLGAATPTVPIVTLNNPGPAANDLFGYAVAISGNRVVVAAYTDDTGATDAGSVYVYDLSSGTPAVPVRTLNNPSPAASDQFGYSVAIADTRVVVAVPLDDTGAADSGTVYVYNLSSGTPTVPTTTLVNPGPGASDWFGISVAVTGTRVVVGANGDNTGAADSGIAYVYDVASGTPTVPQRTLVNPSPFAGDQFGVSVSISGTRVAIGAFGDETGAVDAGSAYVYDLSSGTPTVPVATLNNPAAAASDLMAYSVSISGTRVLVGVHGDDAVASEAGSAYVYNLSSGTPTVPTATLNSPSPQSDEQFGSAVAISGSLVVVGALLDDTGAKNAGIAHVYDLASITPTIPIATFVNPTPALDDYFGYSVAIAGTRVVIGAPRDDAGFQDSGMAYVYDLSSQTPSVPIATLNNPNPASGDYFGHAVAIDGSRVVIGTLYDNTAVGGNAYVYDLGSATPTSPVVTLSNPLLPPQNHPQFGASVAVSGARVVVGSQYDSTEATGSGRAYVYDVSSGSPTVPVATLLNPGFADNGASDRFGHSVAISGTRVAIGASMGDEIAGSSGTVYLYDLSSGNPTTPVLTLPNPRASAPSTMNTSYFGSSVAISGTRVAVGASGDDFGAVDSGIAYVFDFTSATATVPVATLANPTPDPVDLEFFGWSVAIDGTTFVAGAPLDNLVTHRKGSVHVFVPEIVPPSSGTITLSPASPVDASEALTVNFTGWTDASLPLAYTVLIDDVIVSPAGPAASRNLTGPSAAGDHTLKGRIADALGNVTEVTQGFTVLTAQETWRFTFFGTTANIGNAADTADPDGDGWDNRFEYIAGLIPTDPASRLSLHVDVLPGQPGEIVFSPVVAGRQYVVTAKASLTDPAWTPLAKFSISDNGTERTVTDLDPILAAKFYRLEIALP